MHNSLLSGHLGKKKTKAKLSQRYYWYEIREDIDIWISQCDICGANKPPNKSSRAPLGTMPVGAPLDRLATDFLGPLPTTPRGNKFILTVTDYFTKELCKILEIRKTRTSPRNPKCNGQTERFNRSIISMIKSYLRGEQTNWDMNFGCLAGAYRASPNESTCLTPNILMLGREVRLPFELLNKGNPLDTNEGDTSWGNHALKIKERMQRAHCVVRKHLEVNCKRRKDYYDNKTNLYECKVSDKILEALSTFNMTQELLLKEIVITPSRFKLLSTDIAYLRGQVKQFERVQGRQQTILDRLSNLANCQKKPIRRMPYGNNLNRPKQPKVKSVVEKKDDSKEN
ncbi:unnamed protein product [Mytilus coruscus]|uniref:Integrase zinc-binding domain-containing protein n=1 Tax=Mytilus coruscus TaxID=42192 RepID=A0A6J8DRJ6_MYTCO|nr:unnamed protein product [Mytilus coruscus]